MNSLYGSAAKHSSSPMSAIEELPSLAKKITLMWPSRELNTFLQRAVLDGRDGDRQGFPMAVGAELLFLTDLNKVVRAFELAAKLSIKPSEAFGMVDKGDSDELRAKTWSHAALEVSTATRAAQIQRQKPPSKPRRNLISRIFSIR